MVVDPEADRLAFVLAGQRHADHFLLPLADPAGKRVLVLGCGAGTDVLWCLRHGASEVLGIDVLEQGREALDGAAAQLGVDSSRARLLRLPIEDAASLGRRFDLVLSNNVFEHLRDLPAAFRTCASVVEPGSGRVAIFSSPLFLSSNGSHLPHAPWEHLAADPEELRERLIAEGDLPDWHSLRKVDLRTYFEDEITLNRTRLSDFVDAVGDSGLVALHLAILPDPRLAALGGRLETLRRGEPTPSAFDLALCGVALELALPAPGADGPEPLSTSDLRFAAEREVHGREFERRSAIEREAEHLRGEAERLRDEADALRGQVDELRRVLDAVEASWSFRVGRLLTAPGRLLRRLLGRSAR